MVSTSVSDPAHAPLSRAAKLAWLLDSRFQIPGTPIRFGADAIIGLVPGIGDVVSVALGLMIVFEANAMGVPRSVVARMLVNLGIDWVMGLVPLAGDVADVWFKANLRNLALLERALLRKSQGTARVGGRASGVGHWA